MSNGDLPLPPVRLPVKRKPEDYIFLLGAKDAEMDEIEQILKRHKLTYQYATFDGERVHGGNAYSADPVKLTNGKDLVLVECEPVNYQAFTGVIRRIDHHRPGDPGFGKSPLFYWEASSIGQLYTFLGKKQRPSKKHLIIAARDHCRFQVKNCPGVTARDVRNYGRHTIALELGVKRKELDEHIQKMHKEVRRAHHVFIGAQPVADLRRVDVGDVYSIGYMSLYEALADLNEKDPKQKLAALVQTKNKGHDMVKITLMGAVDQTTVLHFMNAWAPSQGLTEIYGCEVRGYAGGYHPKSTCVKAA